MTEHYEGVPDMAREVEREVHVEVVKGDVCSAFNKEAIGTRVTNPEKFLEALTAAIKHFDWSKCRVDGQALIPLPEAKEFVSSSAGKRSDNPEDYVLRVHRGRVEAYLKRERAAPAESLSVVVYTRDALLKDPEAAEVAGEYDPRTTHMIVAVLAMPVENPPYGAFRLVSNLGGGNREALEWSADEIRAKAKASAAYEREWATVAD